MKGSLGMNRRYGAILTLIALLLAGLWAHPEAAARAEAAWKVLFNGQASHLSITELGDGQKMVTVSFPVPPEGRSQEYGVKLETDPIEMAVKVTRVEKKRKTRGPGDCPKCSGSKKCQDCWPAGSGVNTAGLPCIGCNATGDCNFCRGSGVCYTCDGRGMNTGCGTCGKVTAP